MATATKPRFTAQRPKNDAYVGLLTISLLALITSCVLLYLDYAQYGAQKPTNVPKAPNPTPGVQVPESRPPEGTTEPAPGGGDAPMNPTTPAPMGGETSPAPPIPPDTTGRVPFTPAGAGGSRGGAGAGGVGPGGTRPTQPAGPPK